MRFSVAAGEIICLNGGRHGVTVHCTSGLLWLTNGNGCDYCINAGKKLFLEPGSSAVAEALHGAELYLAQTEKAQLSFSCRPVMEPHISGIAGLSA